MIFDINFPPVAPISDGEKRRAPSDDELDALFSRIGEQIARHPTFMAIRMAMFGVTSFTLMTRAVVELLIQRGLLESSALLEVQAIADDMNARSNRKSLRDFIGFAAQGLMRINGRPLSPDDAASLVSAFTSDAPDIGSAISTVLRSMLTPDHLAALFSKANASDDPLQALMDYRLHETPESRIEALGRRLASLEDSAHKRVFELEKDVHRLKIEVGSLNEALESSRREADLLRDKVETFRLEE